MTRVSERNVHAFDVAVSFAGEDRELAEDVVNQLRAAALTVFCDQSMVTWVLEPMCTVAGPGCAGT
jgi:hypothetical protein